MAGPDRTANRRRDGRRPGWRLAATACAVALAACGHDPAATPGSGGDVGGALPPIVAAPAVEVRPSTRPRVRFKGGERLARDLAAALELPEQDLCQELGRFDCVSDVHRVALGGVAPYDQGIWRPREPSAPTVNAADRLVLAACAERARRDLAAPASARIFGPLAGSSAPSEAVVKTIAARLMSRLAARLPDAHEERGLLTLWRRVHLRADPGTQPNEAFATLACYTVGTLDEVLFY